MRPPRRTVLLAATPLLAMALLVLIPAASGPGTLAPAAPPAPPGESAGPATPGKTPPEGMPAIRQTLPNGMELWMFEDHSSPLVASCLWVGVGSVNETGKTSGVCHLLEHLLFDGTATRNREEIQREFERLGVYCNAFTRKEYTAHILSAPRAQFPAALAVQADMLLHSTFPEAEVAKERKVVLEEMKRDRDNPQSFSAELFEGELFRGSPLALTVIGLESAVTSITRDEIMTFYRDHYTADRMAALVLGDFDPREIRARLAELYGSLPPGGGPLARAAEPFQSTTAEMARRRSEEWLETKSTYLRFGFPAPRWSQAEAPAMEMASQLLVGGDQSRLTRRLVNAAKPLAAAVEGSYDLYASGSAWTVTAILADPAQAPDVEAAVAEELRRLARQGPDRRELERAKLAFRVNDAFEMDNLLFFIMGLADWMPRGGYAEHLDFYRRLESVTAAQVRAVVDRYLAPMPGLVHLARPVATTSSTEQSSGRSRTERRVMENGLTLIVRENPLSRLTAVQVLIGHRAELEPPGQEGVANFVMEMLPEGAGKMNREAIAAALADVGARLQVADDPNLPFDDYYWTPDYAYLRLEVVNEFGRRGLDLATTLLRRPTFPADRLGATRERLLGLVAREEQSASAVGRALLRQGLLAGTGWTHPIRGTAESLARLTRQDLVAYHALAFAPNNVVIAVAGGMPLEDVMAALSQGWSDAPRRELSLPAPPRAGEPPSGPARLSAAMNREQSYLTLGRRTAGFTDADMPALAMLGAVLNRRLGLELREKQGLAYQVGAGATFARDFGWFSLSMGTRQENVSRAMEGMQTQLQRLREELVADDELELAANATWAQRVRYRQRQIGQAYFLALHEYLGRGCAFENEEEAELRAVTPQELLRVARAYAGPEGWVAVEVGRDPQPTARVP